MSPGPSPKIVRGLLVAASLATACKSNTDTEDTACFRLNQPVDTPQGPIPIGALRVGDPVWSLDPRTGERVPQTIARIIDASANHTLRLQFSDRVIRAVTARHPFFDVDLQRWVPASKLATGSTLALDRRGAGRLIRIETESLGQPVAVRTLSIAGRIPTFLVDGVVVHNKSLTEDSGYTLDWDEDGYPSDTDCNDREAAIHPEAPEDCTNNLDDDCDTLIDEADPDCQDAESS